MRTTLFALALLAAGPACAGDMTLDVRTPDGQPLADAVVTVRPATGPTAQPIRFAWAMVMNQHNIAFEPYVLVVPVGSDVVFPNKDKVRHHVYSFSPAKKFELRLYGREETRTVRFDKAGVVALGCNIHDEMIGYVVVVDTPYAARSGANGQAVLRGVPAGAASITVWHPKSKDRVARALPVTVTPAAMRQTTTVALRAVQ